MLAQKCAPLNVVFSLLVSFFLYSAANAFSQEVLDVQEIFTVQVGAFSSMKNAQNVLKEFEKSEYKCIIQKTEDRYRVYCGEFKQKQDALVLLSKLVSLGYRGAFIVSQDVIYLKEIFTVQVGALFSMKNAQNAYYLVDELKTIGITCSAYEIKGFYKVYCGEFRKRQDALDLLSKLISFGYKNAFIVSYATKPEQPKVKQPEIKREVPMPPTKVDRGITSPEVVPLKVSLNDEELGEFFLVLAQGDEIFMSRDDLKGTKLKEGIGKDVMFNGDPYVSLKAIPDITYNINEKEASLEIKATAPLFKTQDVDTSYTKPYKVSYPRDTSAFFNYGILYNSDGSSFDIPTEVGVRFRNFLGTSTQNYHKSEDEEKTVRLLTSVRTDDRKTMKTLIFGDFPTTSGTLGSAPLLGGITVSKNFEIDPYYIRYPSLDLRGTIVSPSEVGVYVNDVLVKRETLSPGEFTLKNIPAEVGLGNTKMVIRDIYGMERVITEPFYYSDRLLKPGLQEYSYSIGFLREDFGEDSFSYGSPAMLAFHNYGFSESFKAGYALELSEDVIHIGPTASVLLSRAGSLDLALAISNSHGETGLGGFVGYLFRSKYVDASLSAISFTDNFSNLAVKPSDDKPFFQFTGAIGLRHKDLGSLVTKYSARQLHIGSDTSEITFSYNRVLTKRTAFFASASWLDVEGEESKNEIFCGLHIYFGKDISSLFSYTSIDGDGIKRASVSKSLPVGTGYGFNADVASYDSREDVLGEVMYQNDFGIYGIGYNKFADTESFRASVSGGIGLIDGSVFMNRPMYDSFAKVKIDGVEDVRVYSYGNEVTRTNNKGDAIIPVFRSFHDNKIDIEQEDIPINYNIPTLTQYVNPSFRSGALVNFDVKKIQGFVGNIYIQMNGEKFPAVSSIVQIQVKDKIIEGLIGNDGEFYFENVPSGKHPTMILYNGEECIFDIIIPETEEILVDLGEVICQIK